MSMSTDSPTEAFVERFAAGWAGGADGFFERFLPLMDEDVLLRQPLLPAARGHAGFRALFEPLFAAIPDLRGEVLSWTPEVDGVTIELALSGTVDGLPLAFVTRDRLVLRDGRALERHARFDPRPLLLVALRRPRVGLRLLSAPLRRRLGK
jgi:ketosteroid isomerase-like protein